MCDGVVLSVKGFGVGFKINRVEFYFSSVMVFLYFLYFDYVVSVIDLNDVYDIVFEVYCGFEFYVGLYKVVIIGYWNDFMVGFE